MIYICYKNDEIYGYTDNISNVGDIAYGMGITDYNIAQTDYEDYTPYNNKYLFENGEVKLNPNYKTEQAQKRQAEFEAQFFEIENVGYYRKEPKGYSSAVESINTAFNIVTVAGSLPANTLTFYIKPDFTNAEQCTEDWLVAHQFKNETMTPTEFGAFYAKFIEAWNKQEHLEE